MLKAKSVARCSKPKFIVHDVVQRIVKIAKCIEDPLSKKNVGLRDVVQSAQHDVPIEIYLPFRINSFPVSSIIR